MPVRVCFWGVQHGLATGDYVQFIMKQKHSGSTLTSAALVLFAGALGSLFTLLVTGNLSVPLVGDVKTGDTQQSAAASQLTEKDVNDVTSDSTLLITDATANSVRTIDDLRKVQEQMRVALEDATAERSQLAQTIRQLTVQVENLESDSINFRSLSELNSTIDSPQDAANAALTNNGSPESNSERRIGNLVAAGVDYNNALSIQARQDQYQLDRLDLFDRAEREGWIESDQFNERLSELDDSRMDLREELGDEGYDRYLFAAGRNNRVVISNVIPGSAADIAGLQAGDTVISYANQRVFTTRDLQSATRDGLRGEGVMVNVERQGQVLFLDLPRGPLGVSLNAEQQNPT